MLLSDLDFISKPNKATTLAKKRKTCCGGFVCECERTLILNFHKKNICVWRKTFPCKYYRLMFDIKRIAKEIKLCITDDQTLSLFGSAQSYTMNYEVLNAY